MSWYHDFMHGDGGKILRTFCESFHVCLLQIETCPEKIRRVEKESFTNEVAVDFKTFCDGKKQLRFFNAKFWSIFG